MYISKMLVILMFGCILVALGCDVGDPVDPEPAGFTATESPAALLSAWVAQGAIPEADVNGDGIVNIIDLVIVAQNFGLTVGLDTDPPEVLDVSALNGIVRPGTPIEILFSEPVDEQSIQDGIAIIGVPATVDYDAATYVAVVTPIDPLDPDAYTLSIRRVRDLAGNEMPSVLTVTFIVAAG